MLGIKSYLYGSIAAIVLALTITIYVQHTTIISKNQTIEAMSTKLNVSNQSITDMTTALNSLNAELVAARDSELKKQAEIESILKDVDVKNKSLSDLQHQLQGRKTISNCHMPKDLSDAWNSL